MEVGTVDNGALVELQAKGMLWFELLITASYLGIATALAERMVMGERGDLTLRTLAAAELDASVAAMEAIAFRMARGESGNRLLARALSCRYAAQGAISRVVHVAVEQLGGMAFISDSDIAYLASASQALAFHPPGRPRAAPVLAKGLLGEGLAIE
jgi:alkylation response protein AidB-like acyl-CoA dehydrogenase